VFMTSHILAAALNGDPEAFTALVRSQMPRLHASGAGEDIALAEETGRMSRGMR
jgi:hypothetical protein